MYAEAKSDYSTSSEAKDFKADPKKEYLINAKMFAEESFKREIPESEILTLYPQPYSNWVYELAPCDKSNGKRLPNSAIRRVYPELAIEHENNRKAQDSNKSYQMQDHITLDDRGATSSTNGEAVLEKPDESEQQLIAEDESKVNHDHQNDSNLTSNNDLVDSAKKKEVKNDEIIESKLDETKLEEKHDNHESKIEENKMEETKEVKTERARDEIIASNESKDTGDTNFGHERHSTNPLPLLSATTTFSRNTLILATTYLGEVPIMRNPWKFNKEDKECLISEDGVVYIMIPPEPKVTKQDEKSTNEKDGDDKTASAKQMKDGSSDDSADFKDFEARHKGVRFNSEAKGEAKDERKDRAISKYNIRDAKESK